MKLKNLIILTSIFLFLGAGNPDKGQDKVAVCSACHGSDGNSVVGLWPSLAGQNEKYLTKQLRLVKSGDRVIASMTGLLDNLEDSDLEDIAAYYASQKNTVGQTDESKVELGRKLYYAGNLEKGVPACSACHSPRGLGNAPAAYPLLSGQQPEYVAKALKDYRSGARVNEDPSKIMAAIAYKLDDEEIEALSSFVHGLY
ncbi:cytochrome c4 [Gammaproteobacteria bacterium]|jgi:cytochrome c553|nr:cytochrome c4 [Gammaproteobacteria bacterium]MDG1120623.1 c-type cytochrome [SAR86 cluster bacterium]MDG1230554.1 c-type cytochrome [SAR86 cluster bacterium]MDG1680893.1 c-type cytochrome [SAR86 cluster bacterium]|tara:strand:+ start:704 stop:1300 length:597 start_codon:yes stop_codon:yes gene_type:complete